MTLDGRQPCMEDELWMEDYQGWKTTIDGRQTWMNNAPGWKAALDGSQPWMEEDLWMDDNLSMEYEQGWKTTLEQVPSQRESGIWCWYT